MVSPPSATRPALHLNTNVRQPRQLGVHYDAPLRPRASTRGSPTEPIDSPPFLPQPASGSSDSEAECWMRGRPAESWRPPPRAHTNLFGMLASSGTFNELDLTGFRGHRDTLATLALRRVKHSTDLPIEVYARILRYLDFQSYKSLRLTCRCWSAASTYVRPLRLPPVYALPAEIIKHMYSYLSPFDMDSARHTCRKWMTASLEYRLLAQVMRRAGYWSAVDADTTRNEQLGHPIGGEWRLSKRLATECSLSSSLFLESTIDFTMLLQSISPGQAQAPTLRFIVSSCGRFLLVPVASIVNVYRHGRRLEFLMSIACPAPVLALDMDTSQDRYTIAALLEDRKGLIIDVPELSRMVGRSGSLSPHSEHDTHDVTTAWDLKASPTATPTTSQRPRLPIYTDVYHTSPPPSPSPQMQQTSPVPVQFIPHTMYRNLCSKTSPPLTVAIAPHRRCVAFGSAAGIELHWQDATTGMELSRWIELIGPAEYVYFLPPRFEDEKQKDLSTTLRLIASRAGPTYYNDPITLNEAWTYEHCRYLRGVPLSDSRHLLYTDPNDGDLCLGTGLHHHFGGPKPIKRFVLQRPDQQAEWPRCYTVGRDLQWGVRVAAAFGDVIYLYCVPPDWLVSPTQTSLQGDVEFNKEGKIVIRGTEIGSLPDIVELAIDTSNGEVVVHAFSSTKPARVYQRYSSKNQLETSVNADVSIPHENSGDPGTKVRDFAPFLQDNVGSDHTLQADVSRDERGGMDMGFRALGTLPGCEGEDEGCGIEMDEFEKEETEDEGYGSECVEDEEGNWKEGGDEVDRSLEDEWGDMGLVRLELEVLCGG
ncbi:MAG: hypothetical protein L6R42_004990 [Xanthoria sp. 1 TBL-2021]|nr:MAG: hypothetical protein L6R42_004990 [Xanthoria sp. 1 TBL-2021]